MMEVESVTAAPVSRRDSIAGSLLGMAVGDALGLAYEGLSPRRARRMLGPPICYRLLPNRGLISDDTEHACMLAQSLIAVGANPERFRDELAARLRWWLARLPAGIGMATLRSLLKLWIGYSPARSGVYSAGNGPCMRSPILGAAIDDLSALRSLVTASTRITHSDPKADTAAFAVALASHLTSRNVAIRGDEFLELFVEQSTNSTDEEFAGLLAKAVSAAQGGVSTPAFAANLGLGRGVTGYVFHTVPVLIHAWLQNADDFQIALQAVIGCGGDTDTTAAIVGAIVGSRVGKVGIPTTWLDTHAEWPQSLRWIEQLGHELNDTLTSGVPRRPPDLPLVALTARNVLFATIVLLHGFRRLLPPY